MKRIIVAASLALLAPVAALAADVATFRSHAGLPHDDTATGTQLPEAGASSGQTQFGRRLPNAESAPTFRSPVGLPHDQTLIQR
jgi:hypothetical protein